MQRIVAGEQRSAEGAQGRRAASFSETADIETSSANYARRFDSAAGRWMLDVQSKCVLDMLDGSGPTVLDAGGGHGQLAGPLLQAGRLVTVLSSAEVCRERLRDFERRKEFAFEVGDMLNSPFGDRAFDSVVSVRLVSHCQAWQRLIDEFCRLARYAVIIDYPPLLSFNVFYPILFRMKKSFEGNTRSFAVFRHSEIVKRFEQNGFRLEMRRGQFFFPMVVHRAIDNPAISAAAERVTGICGLNYLFGSPVLAKFVRVRH